MIYSRSERQRTPQSARRLTLASCFHEDENSRSVTPSVLRRYRDLSVVTNLTKSGGAVSPEFH